MKRIADLFRREFNDVFEDTKTPNNDRRVLTRVSAEFILDESLDNVVMYNFVTNKPNRTRYNGHHVAGLRQVEFMAPLFRDICAQSATLEDYTPVALVAKTCVRSGCDLPRGGNECVYSNRANAISGNMILYNPRAQVYSALPSGWAYCGTRGCHIAAAEEALLAAARHISSNRQLLEKVYIKKR